MCYAKFRTEISNSGGATLVPKPTGNNLEKEIKMVGNANDLGWCVVGCFGCINESQSIFNFAEDEGLDCNWSLFLLPLMNFA